MSDKNPLVHIEQLESQIKPSWERKGISAQDHMVELTERLHKINDVLHGRSTDTSMIQSALTDSIELVTYAGVRKDITALKAILTAYTAREKAQNGSSKTERADEGS